MGVAEAAGNKVLHGPVAALPEQGSWPWAISWLREKEPRSSSPERSVPNVMKKFRVAGAAAASNCGVGTQTTLGAALRTRIHSVLWEKKSLFFLTGPVTE